jgi:DNA recombination protein RmuC
LDSADIRSRAMQRALKTVEALPDGAAQALLSLESDAAEEPGPEAARHTAA